MNFGPARDFDKGSNDSFQFSNEDQQKDYMKLGMASKDSANLVLHSQQKAQGQAKRSSIGMFQNNSNMMNQLASAGATMNKGQKRTTNVDQVSIKENMRKIASLNEPAF